MSGSGSILDLSRVREVCAGSWVVPPTGDYGAARGAAIDSREIEAEQIFFAHRGEQTDGHRFVGAAFRAGASLCVIDDPDALDRDALAGDAMSSGPILRVADVRGAMVRLARARRDAMRHATVIGVTGSSGKTTTVRMIDGVLSRRLRGWASRKSHNNTLGVCLTILNAPANGDYLVSEVGTSAPGEIAALRDILRPDIGVITSIGRAHVEGLGSIEAIAAEKADLARELDPNGLALVTGGCAALDRALASHSIAARMLRVGTGEDADVRIGGITMDGGGVRFLVGDAPFAAPAIGAHNAINGTFAVAIGRAMGLDDDEIRAGLLEGEPPAMRLQVERIGGVTVLNDAYNANPDSMLAAIETLEQFEHAGRRVCVLGDMLELGAMSTSAHREIGERIARGSIERAVLVGPAMKDAYEAQRSSSVDATHHAERASLDATALELRDGDLVLVKGSRGMRMERVVESLRDRVASGLRIETRAPLRRPA